MQPTSDLLIIVVIVLTVLAFMILGVWRGYLWLQKRRRRNQVRSDARDRVLELRREAKQAWEKTRNHLENYLHKFTADRNKEYIRTLWISFRKHHQKRLARLNSIESAIKECPEQAREDLEDFSFDDLTNLVIERSNSRLRRVRHAQDQIPQLKKATAKLRAEVKKLMGEYHAGERLREAFRDAVSTQEFGYCAMQAAPKDVLAVQRLYLESRERFKDIVGRFEKGTGASEGGSTVE